MVERLLSVEGAILTSRVHGLQLRGLKRRQTPQRVESSPSSASWVGGEPKSNAAVPDGTFARKTRHFIKPFPKKKAARCGNLQVHHAS
ncbi:hypothetical protein GOB36_32935 [Sinorhizobium meliloti]|uniref:hypothetical protein n=1 Tax=Rhizobium meliloti TaxID=382 RepID=UPI000FDA2E70|nr:hypothetical protein [Sinorhizobium meliloti]MCO6424179.1 hypothetical protein [Sinorhizobium meliloti]MDW9632841.1 hypothetical protein [Sinorhizobium meliloti]MDW9925165.1 hypothetical protein [Sinorhizobium meliloti]MDX0036350.1 hypothetical protein [Sinorhizobium meliloti]RVL28887.1 hypothetical protein CN148_29830 [Sinorhizobium meliloti]